GSQQVTGFVPSGASWVAPAPAGLDAEPYGECAPATYTGCQFANAVFFDGRPLWRVTQLSDVVPGTFSIDYAGGKLYLGNDPTGHTVEIAVAPEAIAGPADGVVVSSLVIQRFANPAQHGAIDAQGSRVVEDNL